MRRGAKLATVAVVAFLVVVIARFPARWAAGALPAGTTCLKLSGTLWSGTCAGLMQAGAPVGDLTWRLRPLRLLTGSLSADVVLARGSGMASGRVDIGPSGTVTAHGLRVALPLDRALVPALPPGMQGSVQADIPLLKAKGLRLMAVNGRIDVRGLTDGRGEPIGDYRLTFPAGASSAPAPAGSASNPSNPSNPGSTLAAEPVGHLTDLGGPFAVDGTVRLTPEPGYVIDAQVAARPGAPPEMVNAMRFLGSPDSRGRRPLSLAGTF